MCRRARRSGGREFDEARVARRRTSPRSGDGPERSEGRAGEAASNLSGCASYLKELAELTRRQFPEHARFVPLALSGKSRSLLSS